MNVLIGIMVWLVVFILFPIVAIAALILLPIVWLISIPLRLIGITVNAVFALLKAILFLPARILGGRPSG